MKVFLKSIIVPACFLFATFTECLSQQMHRQYFSNNNAWLMYFGNHKISKNWGLHLEAQWRRNALVSNTQQLLLRTGINYYLNSQSFVTAGYAFVQTYPYGKLPVNASFPEHRLWQQLQVKTLLSKVELISRLRLEQRFSRLPVKVNQPFEPGPSVYTNRFRLLQRFSIPFKGKRIGDRLCYLTTYDELFVSFGKNVGYNMFEQNRAYTALGYVFPKLGRIEAGYLNQLLFKSDGIKVESNHTLQISLTSAIDFYKRKEDDR